jgi:hypothetical protein
LKRRAGAEITAKALGQIRRNVRQAVEFAIRWIDLQKSRPDQKRGYLQEQAEQLRREISSRQKTILDELNLFQKNNDCVIIAAGITCCRKSVVDIGSLFDPDQPPLGRSLISST